MLVLYGSNGSATIALEMHAVLKTDYQLFAAHIIKNIPQ